MGRTARATQGGSTASVIAACDVGATAIITLAALPPCLSAGRFPRTRPRDVCRGNGPLDGCRGLAPANLRSARWLAAYVASLRAAVGPREFRPRESVPANLRSARWLAAYVASLRAAVGPREFRPHGVTFEALHCAGTALCKASQN